MSSDCPRLVLKSCPFPFRYTTKITLKTPYVNTKNILNDRHDLVKNTCTRKTSINFAQFSEHRTANCRQIVACEGAYIICSTMTSHDTLSAAKSHESELMLFVSVEILWNLLSNESAKASVQLCNMECIS